jgi:hypothetical protein
VGRAIETVVCGDMPKPRYPPTELIKDPFFRMVLIEMLSDSENADQLDADWPQCVQVPEARIKCALDKLGLGCINVDDKLFKWRDDGVLYLNGPKLELLYPYLVKELAPLLRDAYKSIIMVQYQLTGINI